MLFFRPMESNGNILFFNIEQSYVPVLKKTFVESDIQVFESGDLTQSKEIIEKNPPDIVLADFKAVPADAMNLLTFVKNKKPDIFRIAILESEEHKRAIYLVFKGLANSSFEKPHGMVDLMDHAVHILETRKILKEKNLLPLVSTIDNLVALPGTYFKFTRALDKNESAGDIVTLLENDISISTKILQIANSAFFRSSKIGSLKDAFQYLGTHNIKNIVTIFCYHNAEKLGDTQKEAFKAIIKHSLRVNRELFSSYELRTGETLSDSFASAGITHDIGKIIQLKYQPERFNRIIQFMDDNPRDDYYHSELKLGYENETHADLGGHFLDLWNLPEENVHVAMFHHDYAQAMESYRKVFDIFKDVNHDMEICEYTKMFEQM